MGLGRVAPDHLHPRKRAVPALCGACGRTTTMTVTTFLPPREARRCGWCRRNAVWPLTDPRP